ncbi:DUF6843 domain-containing protein [Bacillus sp. SG-1]|uniref:DUF6843 domain-containing protein n=1 Tax=Bacillus sp. SG-1 TaxID=161544 RepID=UPI0001543371|nr:hypothetical protein [Bacillus sp. SG-1]EDL66492.1 hypothetical protein BSG1_04030 [Bacillus sp. SG-1]
MIKKKRFIFLFIAVGLISLFVFLHNRPSADVDEVFLLPEGFKGCVYIHYNQPDGQKLEVTDKKIFYNVPRSGIIHTSSPADFANLSWHKIYVQYVNNDGERLDEAQDVTANYKGGMSSSNNDKTSERRWFLFNENDSCH